MTRSCNRPGNGRQLGRNM